ncbi:basic amino acid ABC transporter substrate-binding protein [Spirochaetia bacterium]|nr:basic amino acid ABC transporter substrate-binding protein [Spirochaetia bacterium]
MNLRKIAVLACAVMVLLSCNKQGGKKADNGSTITKGVFAVGMEIGYPPMEYYDIDGVTPIGFDVQLAKAVADKLGLTVKYIDTAWDGIFAGVDTGKYDAIMSSVTITEARLENYAFTKPYIKNAQALVLLKGSTVPRTPAELGGLSVAYQAETASDDYMSRLAEKGLKFNPYEYDKVINCFDDLRLGRVDAIVCDSVVAYFYTAQSDTPFEIVWEGEGELLGICLKKGNDALSAQVEKALDELFADGTVAKISQNIFGSTAVVDAARE